MVRDSNSESLNDSAALVPAGNDRRLVERRGGGQGSVDQRNPFLRRLCSQNPLYIISAGCTVHGIGLWFKGGDNGNPWMLMGLIGSYILLMALAAYGVVRFGKVWEDARSIFVIILLLFVELTLSFDGTLVRDPATGRMLLVVGLVLALMVTEGLLFGLRIRFRVRYRIPYYLMMGQLFLYPLFLLPVLKAGNTGALSWRLFLFSPLAAVTILSLLPAVRGGRWYIRHNGTPWKWPLYPWTVFVTLIACLAVRAFAICAAFDPVLSQSLAKAMELQSSFNGYFLLPIILAIAVLILEAGLQSKRKKVSLLALLVAAAGVGLSGLQATSIPQIQFLEEYSRVFASPVYVALCAATVFFLYAFVRKSPFAEPALNAAIGLHLVIGPATDGFMTRLTEPVVWPLLFLAGLHIGLGCWRHQPRRLVAGVLGAIATLHLTVLSDYAVNDRNAATVHLALIVILVAGIVFNDWLLKSWAAAKIAFLGGVALIVAPRVGGIEPWIPVAYAGVLAVIAVLCAIGLKSVQFGLAATFNGVFVGVETSRWFLLWLRRQPDWQGIAFYLSGLACFALAVLVSVLKSRRLNRTMTN